MLKNVLKLHQCLINYCPTNTAKTVTWEDEQRWERKTESNTPHLHIISCCHSTLQYLCLCSCVSASCVRTRKTLLSGQRSREQQEKKKKKTRERERKRYWMTKCETVDQRNDTEHQYLKSIARICSLFLLYWICLCGYETPQRARVCVCVCVSWLHSSDHWGFWYWVFSGHSSDIEARVLFSAPLLSCPVLSSLIDTAAVATSSVEALEKHNYQDNSEISTKLL